MSVHGRGVTIAGGVLCTRLQSSPGDRARGDTNTSVTEDTVGISGRQTFPLEGQIVNIPGSGVSLRLRSAAGDQKTACDSGRVPRPLVYKNRQWSGFDPGAVAFGPLVRVLLCTEVVVDRGSGWEYVLCGCV